MKKVKFKVGDKVQLKGSYVTWLINWIPEGYSVGGKYKPGTEEECFAFFAAREFAEPMRGTIIRPGAYLKHEDPYFYVELSNQYGKYSGYVYAKNFIKLESKKKGNKRNAKKRS